MKKQLTKSTKYKALAGVLGGVAEYYDTDPVLVRLGYLALTLVTGVGPGILLYLIAILVIPDAPVAPAEPVAAPVRDAAPEPAQPAHDAEAARSFQAEKEVAGLRDRLIMRDMPGFHPRHADTYRIVAGDLIGPVDMLVYADRTAHIFWPEKQVAILKSQALADTGRRTFDLLWSQGHEPLRTTRAVED